MIAFFFSVAALLLTTSPRAGSGQRTAASPVLALSDCVKCHPDQVSDIESRGGAHRDKVTCIDCHQGHPPRKRDIIPRCARCHAGRSHFALPGCLGCHANPHQPLEIRIAKGLKAPCLTCHEEEGRQLEEHPSMHGKFSCTTFCHPLRHPNVPSCFKCHQPHSDAMGADDCRKCHKAHMPLQVSYGPRIPSEFCGACHDREFRLLTTTPAKHRQVACVRCHVGRHKAIPRCSRCHGHPHPEYLHRKFPRCGTCHGIAHNVNPGYKGHREK